MTARTIKRLSDQSVLSAETFAYDAAGNLTDAEDSCFQYDTNNRLVAFGGSAVSYDMDGNLLSNGSMSCTYDSANRLITAGGHTYTYNAEEVRIRNLCAEEDTAYTYDTNARLSRLLTKTTGSNVTKYVYGLGLIGEQTGSTFRTYHFDCRGSTVAITDANGIITDTFAYDTYGKLISRTGTSAVIFGYNGRDGVVTDTNGLIYMRARYYSPDMKRFVNADVIAGQISNAITLNRYAYANGNPVSFVDPFGLSAERGSNTVSRFLKNISDVYDLFSENLDIFNFFKDSITNVYDYIKYGFRLIRKGNYIVVKGARTAAAIRRGITGTRYSISSVNKYWDILGDIDLPNSLKSEFLPFKPSGRGINGGAVLNYLGIALKTGVGIAENIEAGTRTQKVVSDAIVDVAVESGIIAGSTAVGSVIGSIIPIPIVGTVVGTGVGYIVGEGIDFLVNEDFINGKSIVDWTKEGAGWVADRVVDAGEWIGETVSDVWDATTDFVEDTGEWIADKAGDAWDATTDFFEDAGNAIGGFFAGIFG